MSTSPSSGLDDTTMANQQQVTYVAPARPGFGTYQRALENFFGQGFTFPVTAYTLKISNAIRSSFIEDKRKKKIDGDNSKLFALIRDRLVSEQHRDAFQSFLAGFLEANRLGHIEYSVTAALTGFNPTKQSEQQYLEFGARDADMAVRKDASPADFRQVKAVKCDDGSVDFEIFKNGDQLVLFPTRHNSGKANRLALVVVSTPSATQYPELPFINMVVERRNKAKNRKPMYTQKLDARTQYAQDIAKELFSRRQDTKNIPEDLLRPIMTRFSDRDEQKDFLAIVQKRVEALVEQKKRNDKKKEVLAKTNARHSPPRSPGEGSSNGNADLAAALRAAQPSAETSVTAQGAKVKTAADKKNSSKTPPARSPPKSPEKPKAVLPITKKLQLNRTTQGKSPFWVNVQKDKENARVLTINKPSGNQKNVIKDDQLIDPISSAFWKGKSGEEFDYKAFAAVAAPQATAMLIAMRKSGAADVSFFNVLLNILGEYQTSFLQHPEVVKMDWIPYTDRLLRDLYDEAFPNKQKELENSQEIQDELVELHETLLQEIYFFLFVGDNAAWEEVRGKPTQLPTKYQPVAIAPFDQQYRFVCTTINKIYSKKYWEPKTATAALERAASVESINLKDTAAPEVVKVTKAAFDVHDHAHRQCKGKNLMPGQAEPVFCPNPAAYGSDLCLLCDE